MSMDPIGRHRPQTLGASDDENIPTVLPWDADAAIAAPGTARAYARAYVDLRAHPIDRREIDRIRLRAMGNTDCTHLSDSQRSFTRR